MPAASRLLKTRSGYAAAITVEDKSGDRTDAAPVSVSRVADMAALRSEQLADEGGCEAFARRCEARFTLTFIHQLIG